MYAHKGLLLALTAGTLMLSGCNNESTKTSNQIEPEIEKAIPVYDVNQLATTLDQAVALFEAQDQAQEWNRIKHWAIDMACTDPALTNIARAATENGGDRAEMLPVRNDADSSESESQNDMAGPRIRLGAYRLQDGLEIHVRGASHSPADSRISNSEHDYERNLNPNGGHNGIHNYSGVGFGSTPAQAYTARAVQVSHAANTSEAPKVSSRCYKF